MRRVLFLFIIIASLFTLWSCKEKKYEFVGSRYGKMLLYSDYSVQDVANGNNSSPSMKVAIDLYRCKTSDGYEYIVKNQEGNEYKLREETVASLAGYTHYVENFRHKDYIGTLWVAP